MIDDWTSIDILSRQLDLCGVAPGSSCAVLTDPTSVPGMGDRAVLAARRLGADAVAVGSPSVTADAAPDAAASRVAATCDFVVDLTVPGCRPDRAGSDGPRVLAMGGVTLDQLRVLRPHIGVSRRVERARERLREGRELAVVSNDGTNVTVGLTGATVEGRAGIVSATTPWARWPDGMVSVEPAAGSVEGTVVAMPRDLIVEVGTYVRSPLTMAVRNDHLSEVSGSAGDADLVRALLGRADDIDGYGIAGVAIGMANEPAVRTGDPRLGPYVDPSTATRIGGQVSIAFGANATAGRPGGDRMTLVLHGHTVTVDGRPLVVDGDLHGDLRPDVYERAH